MGISSKKTTTENTNTSTQTPNVPQWGVDSLKGLNEQIEGIAGTDPTKFVAPASGLQTQAFAGASGLGDWMGTNTDATNLASKVGAAEAPQAHAVSSADSISKFLNPYLKQVVDSSMADFDQSAGETRAAQAARGAQAKAFGGSRWGLQEGETEGQIARARGALDSGLRSGAYTDAEAQANNDANRGQATELANLGAKGQNLDRQSGIAGLLGQLATERNAGQIGDVTTQASLGETERGIDADTRTAPISLAQTVAELLGQNQLPLLTGSTTNSHGTGSVTQNPSTWDQIKEGVSTATKLAALFSDRRLKRDIKRVGTLENGLAVYAYRYVWGSLRYVGVMAQEVLKVKPEAVHRHPSGFLMVDYGAL